MSAIAQIAVRHIGARNVAKLAKAGIRVIATQAIPDMSSPMPYANAETGYVVDDNGTGRVWTIREILARV